MEPPAGPVRWSFQYEIGPLMMSPKPTRLNNMWRSILTKRNYLEATGF